MGNPNQQDQTQTNKKLDSGGQHKLAPGTTVDPEAEVRENEDASLQDDSYAFEEDTPEDKEFLDVDDRLDFDNDDDFVS